MSKGVLDTFRQAGLEVRVWAEGTKYPWDPGVPIPCVYAGKPRMITTEACKWHHDRRSPLCEGCPKATWLTRKTQPVVAEQKQGRLFG